MDQDKNEIQGPGVRKTKATTRTKSKRELSVEEGANFVSQTMKTTPSLDQIIGTLQRYSGMYERFVNAQTRLVLQLRKLGDWLGVPKAQVTELIKKWSPESEEPDQPIGEIHETTVKSNGHLSLEIQENAAPISFISNAMPFLESIAAIRKQREYWGKECERLAKMLPVWPWVRDSVPGVGALLLGRVIGQTGDLTAGKIVTLKMWRGDKKGRGGKPVETTIASYTNPGKVWKRMGLAPGQKRIRRNTAFRGGQVATPEENVAAAQEAGYNPKRRALMFVVGTGFIKATRGKYNEAYYSYKARKEAEHPDWTLKEHPGHIHKMAMRYAEKLFLKDLWIQWQRAVGNEGAIKDQHRCEIQDSTVQKNGATGELKSIDKVPQKKRARSRLKPINTLPALRRKS